MENSIKGFFFGLGLILIGASGWIALERFEKVPAMCIVDGQLYDQIAKRK